MEKHLVHLVVQQQIHITHLFVCVSLLANTRLTLGSLICVPFLYNIHKDVLATAIFASCTWIQQRHHEHALKLAIKNEHQPPTSATTAVVHPGRCRWTTATEQ